MSEGSLEHTPVSEPNLVTAKVAEQIMAELRKYEPDFPTWQFFDKNRSYIARYFQWLGPNSPRPDKEFALPLWSFQDFISFLRDSQSSTFDDLLGKRKRQRSPTKAEPDSDVSFLKKLEGALKIDDYEKYNRNYETTKYALPSREEPPYPWSRIKGEVSQEMEPLEMWQKIETDPKRKDVISDIRNSIREHEDCIRVLDDEFVGRFGENGGLCGCKTTPEHLQVRAQIKRKVALWRALEQLEL